MKISFLKIIKGALKDLLCTKCSLWLLILGIIIMIPAFYLLDTYIFPDFSSKIDNRIVGKVFIVFFVALFILYIIAYYAVEKYKTTDEIKKDIKELGKGQRQEDEINLAPALVKVITGIFKFLLFPIFMGLIIQASWQNFTSIKDQDIILFDVGRDDSNSIPNISVSL